MTKSIQQIIRELNKEIRQQENKLLDLMRANGLHYSELEIVPKEEFNLGDNPNRYTLEIFYNDRSSYELDQLIIKLERKAAI